MYLLVLLSSARAVDEGTRATIVYSIDTRYSVMEALLNCCAENYVANGIPLGAEMGGSLHVGALIRLIMKLYAARVLGMGHPQ